MTATAATTRLVKIINRFPATRVLVVGDVMMDHYVWGSVSRISPEAPVPVVNVTRETQLLGAAANVVWYSQSVSATHWTAFSWSATKGSGILPRASRSV